MSVAICIPTYNQAKFLEAAVRSALAQTFPGCEIWVSDDASTDETSIVMARLLVEHPAVRYIQQAKNCGIAANNNWLLQQPAVDYIVRLDSDDCLEPGYVAAMVAELEATPAAGYAHCAIQQIDQEGNVTRTRRLANRGKFQSADEALRASILGYKVAANICTFRKSVLEACGYYRTGMNFAEDWDLSVRIAAAGWGNSYLDERLAKYRWWVDTGGRARRKKSEIEGCLAVFERSLQPAFLERGWNLQELQRARERFAINHADVILSPLFSAAEKNEILELLYRLGGGPALDRHLVLLRSRLGFLVPWQKKARTWFADLAKAGLSTLNR